MRPRPTRSSGMRSAHMAEIGQLAAICRTKDLRETRLVFASELAPERTILMVIQPIIERALGLGPSMLIEIIVTVATIKSERIRKGFDLAVSEHG